MLKVTKTPKVIKTSKQKYIESITLNYKLVPLQNFFLTDSIKCQLKEEDIEIQAKAVPQDTIVNDRNDSTHRTSSQVATHSQT